MMNPRLDLALFPVETPVLFPTHIPLANAPQAHLTPHESSARELAPQIAVFMQDEATAAALYAELLRRADHPAVSAQIRLAMEDEEKHYRMLRRLGYTLTGRVMEAAPEPVTVQNLREGLLKAIPDEYDAFEAYRDTYLLSRDPAVRDIFFELMTDELEHAGRFLYALQLLR